MMTTNTDFKFIDLFCGIGGFHQAMSGLGGTCVFACDVDENCRCVYENNYGITPAGDITKINVEDIPAHDVLCAGYPCTPYSKSGKRLGFADKTRGTLFFDICRILKHHRPKYALLENVRNLISHDDGRTWATTYGALTELGYHVPPEPVVFSPHYIGIPQHRERVFIMCTRNDLPVPPEFRFLPGHMKPCDIDTVLENDDEIANLERYQLDKEQIDWIDIWNEFIQNIKCESGLPGFPIWSECLRDGHMCTDSSLPKWKRDFINKNKMLYRYNESFIAGWMEKAMKNKLFFGSKAKLEWQAGETDHPDLWSNIMQVRPSGLRIKPGTYFPTLVAMNQTSIIGKRRRYITPRECARLQSFPDDFIIDENESQAYKQFGNSVNVEVVKLFAKYMFGDKDTRSRYSCVDDVALF